MKQIASVGALVIGGGPAGLAPLLAASRGSQLDSLLANGLALVERGDRIGAGGLRRYQITSDSAAETFLSAVIDHPDAGIAALADHPLGRALAACGREPVPLRLAGAFLDLLGLELARVLRTRSGGLVLQRHSALRLRREDDGGWRVRLLDIETGTPVELVTRAVLLALGGSPVAPGQVVVAGIKLAALGDRLVHSEQVLDTDGYAMLEQRFASSGRRPKIVVLGGSTSAISTVRVLLERLGGLLEPGAVTLMHRRRLRPWYRSASDAVADGFTDFGPDDLCPVSAMVHRFGGLRFDSREIVCAALGLGGRVLDPRIRLHRLASGDRAANQEAARLLHDADLVVSAIGYRPRRLPVFDREGKRIALKADQPDGSLVGVGASVLDAEGKAIDGLFGIGLAAGYRPEPSMGGERSFAGQVNGLWLWQNDVGRMIADRLVAAAPSHDGRNMPQTAVAA